MLTFLNSPGVDMLLRMLFVCCLALPVLASDPGPAMAPAVALTYRAENLKKAYLSHDPGKVKAAVREVEVLRHTYGTLDVMPLVEAMTLWAREQGEQGRPDLGLEVVQGMEPWAPRHPGLLGARIILMRMEGLSGYVRSLPEVLDLTRIRLSHPTQRWLWLVQHLAWVRIMAVLMLWAWTLTMVIRYRSVFRNIVEEPLLDKGIQPALASFLSACVLAAPVLLFLDPSVAAMLWLCLLVPFLDRMEVKVSMALILIQLVHPGLALMEPEALAQPEPSIVSLQLRPQILSDAATGLASLPAPDRAFLAGWRQLQARDWAGAEATFTALVGNHPNQAEVKNNLGVALYQSGNADKASACFDEAYTLSPGNAEVCLNESIVAFKRLDSVVGLAKQEEARLGDPTAFARIMAANQSLNDQRTFPMPLPNSPERSLALSRHRPQRDPEPLWTPAILLNLVLPIGAALAFHLRHLRVQGSSRFPLQCARCGEPFYGSDSPDGTVCTKCHHLFVIKDGLHGESRKKKVDGVASFQRAQRWSHRVLILLLPGADLCFTGRVREGLIELACVCFALGIVMAMGRMVRYPGEILQDPNSIWLPLGVALLAVFYVRSWFKLLPRRS
jgi:hypothetical protein